MNLLDLYVKITTDDQASVELDKIATNAAVKGSLITSVFSGAVGLIQNAAGAVYGFGSSIINTYSQFEQNVGGIETLFKDASDTVVENSRKAFDAAGVSMNQYMQQATSLASAMIQGVTKSASTATEAATEVAEKALDAQYKAQQRAFSRQATAFQRQLSDQYEARQKAFQKELQAAQEANAREVDDFNSATQKRLSIMEKEYERKVELIDSETSARIKAIDDQIKALQDQGEADEDAEREAERSAKLAELNKRVESEKTFKKRQEAAEELAAYEARIAKEDRDRERKDQIEALKEQRDEIAEGASERKSELQKQYSAEVAAYRESRQELLTEMQKTQQAQLQKMQESQQQQLKALQRSQQDQMTAFRESQQDQLEALQESISARKKAMKEAASNDNQFVEATAEDYQRAAELVDMAIIDMSDNANKMGTDLGMIQNAYQGFSKSNFMMLDNLKLGFGGTKSEMERLLDTAEQIKAKGGETVEYSVDNLADIVEAIHTVQTEYEISGYSLDEITQKLKDQSLTEQELRRVAQDMGITYEEALAKMRDGSLTTNDALILTGTTSREANSTIEGSLRSMGAAWENWLIAIADPDTDLAEATDDLVERIAIAADNIVPRIGVVVGKLGELLAEKGPELTENFKESFLQNLPEDMQERFGEFMTQAQAAIDLFFGALSAAAEISAHIKEFFDWIDENKDVVIPAVGGITGAFVALKTALGISGLVTALTGAMGGATAAAGTLEGGVSVLNGTLLANPIALVVVAIVGLISWLVTAYNTSEEFRNKVDSALSAVREKFEELWNGARETFGNIVNWFRNLPNTILNAVGSLRNTLFNAGGDLINGLIDGINDGVRWLGDTLGGIGSYIVQHKGPPEYDKVMLRGNGKLIIGGLIDSIAEEIPKLGKVMDSVNMAILGGVDARPSYGMAEQANKYGMGMLGGISIHIDELAVREEADIDRIADDLYTKIRREQEAYGWSTSFTMA